MPKTILVVDDEPDLVEVVRYNLEQAHYRVVTAASGAAALNQVRKANPELLVLDIMLPDLSGTEVCRTLRGDPRTRAIPIIFLTAKVEEVDRVVGLELGADDYLTKPFSPRELVLRVGAILRRAAGRDAEGGAGVVEVAQIRLDPDSHQVWVAGAEVNLTATEFLLLETLLRHPGRVFSRDQLLDRVWGITAEVTTRTVDTHINRLRDRLGTQAEQVETVRGVGYRLRPEAG